jgi:hypothetical protein
MSVLSQQVSVQENDSHIQSLLAKHEQLSEQIEVAQRDLSTTDYYLNQLKKQKLLVKEKIEGIRGQR